MADGAPCGRQRRARAVSPRRARTRRAVPGSAVALVHALAFPLVLLLSPARARAVAGADAAAPRTLSPAKRPHVVFVLVDDLGRGNAGWTHMLAGAQPPPWVKTPRLNDLAMREGRVLQRHYVHYVCTPTRSALQTGRFPVHVTTNLYNPENPAAGIPRNMTGVAEKLRDGGYATAFVGKVRRDPARLCGCTQRAQSARAQVAARSCACAARACSWPPLTPCPALSPTRARSVGCWHGNA